MKYLIVNADDFGLSPGVNRGIAVACRDGVVTSASLMVDQPFSGEACEISAGLPQISVGLHVQLTGHRAPTALDLDDAKACAAELRRQLDRFRELLGRDPSHLDSHHDVHTDPRMLPSFLALADECDLPLRGHSRIRHLEGFYGCSGEGPNLERISVGALRRMLDTEVAQGVTELTCHPGYVDRHLRSSYASERELELRTLCDPRIRRHLDESGIVLTGFGDTAGAAR